ncbi:MAG: glycosyltransferase family 2 protein [Bacteroidales bacterium]|nr:glycosyltransferase family 2 protein [Bacteroidales bacterium]
MKTAVVILNWNTERFLRAFLPGLVASCPPDARVVVADSGSDDGSLEYVTEAFPEVITIPLGGNYGFTGGYNLALKDLEAEYYLLLNSDIEVSPGWLEPLVEYMDSHPECGACGPKLHALEQTGDGGFKRTSRFEYAGAAGGYVDRYGYPFCRGRVLKRLEEDHGQYDIPAQVLWVSGACLLTRASLWKRLGGLDDRFFAHMEEIDYCWRAQLLGYTVAVVPQSTVWHLGGGTLSAESPHKLMLNYRNSLLFLDGKVPAVRFCVRYLLDYMSALVYVFTGRFAYAGSVFRAHREYRRLRNNDASGPRNAVSVTGYWKICIILQSFVRGEGIFRYLKAYEDSHRGSR